MAIVLSASAALADAVRPIPWLTGVTSQSVYVSLEADNTDDATVDFGLTAGYGMTAITEDTQSTDFGGVNNGYSVHNIKLTGLEPNTQYHDRVTQGASVSADYSFWTAPEPGQYARWGLASDMKAPLTTWYTNLAAECGCSGNLHADNAALRAAEEPRMMVYAGDLSNPGRDLWSAAWFIPNLNALNATVPFVDGTGTTRTGTP